MSNVEITGWNDAGFKALISSPEVRAMVDAAAEQIAANAGDGFEVSHEVTEGWQYNREIAVVRGVTYEARAAEATDKVLSKAVIQCASS